MYAITQQTVSYVSIIHVGFHYTQHKNNQPEINCQVNHTPLYKLDT